MVVVSLRKVSRLEQNQKEMLRWYFLILLCHILEVKEYFYNIYSHQLLADCQEKYVEDSAFCVESIRNVKSRTISYHIIVFSLQQECAI